MKRIMVYDDSADYIEELSERYDMTEAEIVDILIDIVSGEEDDYFL